MRAWLYRVLKVPPDPALPPGSRESVQVFRAAENFYRLLLVQWGLKQIGAAIGIVVSLSVLHGISAQWSGQVRFWVNTVEWVGIGFYLVQLPFTFVMVRLNYELRWYIVTDRSLRIRFGLWQVREMTMTFANIQHLAVHQGPLQRLLGVYDLKVRTAGGGGGEEESQGDLSKSKVTHIGYFHGVANAPAIRNLIVERMKRVRDAGLGDTANAPGPGPAGEDHGADTYRTALAELRAETSNLRNLLAGSRAAHGE